jgi:hypothetical protein
MTTTRLKWYSDIKRELSKYGAPIDDIQKLAKLIKGIREYGFDTDMVLDEFTNQEMLKAEYRGYREGITRLKDQHDALNRDCSSSTNGLFFQSEHQHISGIRGHGFWTQRAKTFVAYY